MSEIATSEDQLSSSFSSDNPFSKQDDVVQSVELVSSFVRPDLHQEVEITPQQNEAILKKVLAESTGTYSAVAQAIKQHAAEIDAEKLRLEEEHKQHELAKREAAKKEADRRTLAELESKKKWGTFVNVGIVAVALGLVGTFVAKKFKVLGFK